MKNFLFGFLISLIIIFIFVFSVLAWNNPPGPPPSGGGYLQTQSNQLLITTTTRVTSGNFIVENGNVGIGTTGPQGIFHIKQGGGISGSVYIDADQYSYLFLRSDRDATTGGPYSWALVNSDSGQFQIREYGSSDAFVDYRLVINRGGNVGIGTTTPVQKLSVVGDIGLSGGNRFIGTTDNYALILRTNNTARIYITNTGNVGIGTTNPTAKLDVQSPLAATGNLDAGQILVIKNPNLPLANGDTRFLTFGSLDASTAFIRGVGRNVAIIGGNVGIGTTNPTQKLDVSGNVQFSGALMPGGNAGTPGQALISNGPGSPPTWDTRDNTGANISQFTVIKGSMDWVSCYTTCRNATDGGFTDWRMPTLDELFWAWWSGVITPPDGWSYSVWTASPDSTSGYWEVFGESGGDWFSSKSDGLLNCRCVR